MKNTNRMAFGVEPSNRKYRLRLARYVGQSELLAGHLQEGRRVVLDVGCGKGRLARYWRGRYPDREEVDFIGIDLCSMRLARCRDLYKTLLRVDIQQGWPFPDATFDAVVCDQVLEHFPDSGVEWILSEIVRVVKPGGIVLVGAPIFTRAGLAVLPIALFLRNLVSRKAHTHEQHWSLRELRGRIQASGLRPVETRGYRIFSLVGSALEDFRWYYDMHHWLGRQFPGLCVEATVCARSVKTQIS